MKLKTGEINSVNGFLSEEIPKSIGIKYAPIRIKNCFNLKQENGALRIRKKK